MLRAMHQTLVEHGLCLREHTDEGPLLVFPSYFKRERPDLEEHPPCFVSYRFNGPLDEIYATLVVRLHHTEPFEKDQLWRFAADFKTPTGKLLGLKLTRRAERARRRWRSISSPGSRRDQGHLHPLRPRAPDAQGPGRGPPPALCLPTDAERPSRTAGPSSCGSERDSRTSSARSASERVPLWDLIEEQFASPEFIERVRLMEEQAKAVIDNESRELILVGHAYAIAGEAGQIYRQYASSDHGIDGEIEFKDQEGKASGKRLYLQLKSGDSYLTERKSDDDEIFTIKNPRWPTTGSSKPFPSCWSSGPPTARSGGWRCPST